MTADRNKTLYLLYGKTIIIYAAIATIQAGLCSYCIYRTNMQRLEAFGFFTPAFQAGCPEQGRYLNGYAVTR
ncbi:MAG: hypothetical protein HFJ04_12320 [Lachnospiraceae bacterium]|nr:hypothetical protein [Lachnospiraceae bacterium]